LRYSFQSSVHPFLTPYWHIQFYTKGEVDPKVNLRHWGQDV